LALVTAQFFKMKILHIIPSIASVYGGPSKAVIEIVKSINKTGEASASIATTNDDYDEVLDVPLNCWCDYQSVPVIFFPRFSPPVRPIRNFCISPSMTTWLWTHLQEYDVVHVHGIFTYPSTVAMAICRQQKVPYLNRPFGQLCQWSLEQSQQKKAIYLKVIEKANLQGAKVLHLTALQEQTELTQLQWHLSSVIIPHGLTPPKLIKNSHGQLCQLLGITEEIPILLFLSRLHPKKGLDKLIPALARLEQNFAFVLAGSGTPEYEAEIDQLLAKYQLKSRTYKLGFVAGQKKNLCFQGADLYLLPSYSENFGIAVLEALGAATPTLVTPGVALAPDIERHQVGYVVPQEPTAIHQAIEKYLSLSSSERAELSQQARQFVLENYTWDKIAPQLVSIYRWILGEGSKPDCISVD
jgi:glycosyltransferase involved in cell wall biosynthesis